MSMLPVLEAFNDLRFRQRVNISSLTLNRATLYVLVRTEPVYFFVVELATNGCDFIKLEGRYSRRG